MSSHWNVLGLEPTTDAVVIKRAYARMLKQTRPDDDADAYQALRQAYDEALAEARWLQHALDAGEDEEDADAPEGQERVGTEAPAPSTVDPGSLSTIERSSAGRAFGANEQPPAAPENEFDASDDDLDDADVLGIESVAEQMESAWCDGGAEALKAIWPTVEQALLDLPLHHRADASRECAEFVLDDPDLPPEFLVALARHFEWGMDFRAERELGPGLAAELYPRVREAVEWLDAPEQREAFAGLYDLDRVAESGIGLRALWFPVFTALPLATEMARPTAELEQLRLKSPLATLRLLVRIGTLGRVLLAAVILFCVLLGRGRDTDWSMVLGEMIGALLIFGLLCSYIVNLIDRALGQLYCGSRERQLHWRYGAGLLLAVVMTAMVALPWPRELLVRDVGMDETASLVWFGCFVAGLLAWPARRPWTLVCVPLLLLLAQVGVQPGTPPVPLAAAFAWATSCLIMALWLQEWMPEFGRTVWEQPLRALRRLAFAMIGDPDEQSTGRTISTLFGGLWLLVAFLAYADVVMPYVAPPLLILLFLQLTVRQGLVTGFAGVIAAWLLITQKGQPLGVATLWPMAGTLLFAHLVFYVVGPRLLRWLVPRPL